MGKKQPRGPEGHEGRPESQLNVSRRKGSIIQDAADDVKKTESTIGYSNLEATWQRSLFRVGQERLKKKWRQQEENSRHFVF